MLKFLKSNWFIIILTIVVFAIFGWFLKIKYFNQIEDLNNYIPTNTVLTGSLNLSELNATIIQKNKLSQNTLIQSLLNKAQSSIADYLHNYQINWYSLKDEYFDPQATIFLTENGDQLNWGFLIKAKNKQLSKVLANQNLLQVISSYNNYSIFKLISDDKPTIYFSFINNNIFTACSSIEVCENTMNQYFTYGSSSWQKAFSVISLKPLGTLKVHPNIIKYLDKYPLLVDTTAFIKPILDNGPKLITVELNQEGDYLNWQIINFEPNKTILNQTSVAANDMLANIHFKPDTILLSTHLTNLFNETNNKNPLIKAAYDIVASKYHLNLAELVKRIDNSPIMIATSQENKAYLIIVPTHNQTIIIEAIKNILGKFNPKKVIRSLPDNSLYTELIIDTDKVRENKYQFRNTDITEYYIESNPEKMYTYMTKNYLFVSNDNNLLQDNLDDSDIYLPYCIQKNLTGISDLVYLKLSNDTNKFNLNSNLFNISEISIINQSAKENLIIKGCLDIK